MALTCRTRPALHWTSIATGAMSNHSRRSGRSAPRPGSRVAAGGRRAATWEWGCIPSTVPESIRRVTVPEDEADLVHGYEGAARREDVARTSSPTRVHDVVRQDTGTPGRNRTCAQGLGNLCSIH